MGRTIASITQTWQQEEAALNRFKRALRKEDQILLDELLVLSRLHLAEASYASNLYPLDMYLIAILLEVYKQLKSAQKKLNGGIDPREELDASKENRFIALLDAAFAAAQTAPQTPPQDANLRQSLVANKKKKKDHARRKQTQLPQQKPVKTAGHFVIAETAKQPNVRYDEFEEAP